MIIKVKFEDNYNFDYFYCPNNISIKKSEIRNKFYEWIDFTNEDHPFWWYENGMKIGLDYRSDAIIYWINKYLLTDEDKAYIIDSYTNKNLHYDLIIEL